MADIRVTFSKTNPPAPAGKVNVDWQSDGAANPHFSANVPEASGSDEGLVKLAGDLAGTAASPVVAKVQGTAVKSGMTPSDGDVFTWSGSNNRWENLPAGGGGGANASSLRGVNIATAPTANRDGLSLIFDGTNWRPYHPEPYRVQEAHADMSGNSIGMYTGGSSGGTFRWATNGAGGTARVDATATEKMLFQMQTSGAPNGVCVYGCNQSLHLPYTLGNVLDCRSRYGMPSIVDVRFWFGLSDWTNSDPTSDWNSDTPSHNFVGFRFSTVAGDTNFQCIVQTDSTHQTVVDSGVAANTAMHRFSFYYDGSAVQFYIDGANVGSISTNLMATSLKMEMITAIEQANSTFTTKALNMDFVAIFQ